METQVLIQHLEGFERDMDWIQKRYDNLVETYTNEYVAVLDERVVDHDRGLILIPVHYETILGTVILNEVKNLREVCGEILHSLRSFRMTGMSLIFNWKEYKKAYGEN